MSIRFFNSFRPARAAPAPEPQPAAVGRSWDQIAYLGDPVNATTDPYFISFLDGATPTVTLDSGFLAVDFSQDLSAHLISGIAVPCVFPKPYPIASRPGGHLLSGQRRDIPLPDPYVNGIVGIDPGDPEDHLALLKAANVVTDVWIVAGGAFPAHTPQVWPFLGTTNLARFQASAIFATSLTLKRQHDLDRAQLASGAMAAELQYFGTLPGIGLLQ